ncbi:hypothetical protein B0O99DRAFT_651648 [Bisporella sp. PMI_857]|nr:hypothetical protein B0O99DRAFT_651648 [Bisporella sp. PMI_857]
MAPKLKPLLLPQIVEARRQRESISDSDLDLPSKLFYTQSSTMSDIPSPVTPTFSTRGHLRYPSSASSVDSFHNSLAGSPSSPTFLPKSGKRSLPDVQEEPHDERDNDAGIFDESDNLWECLCEDYQCSHRDKSMSQSSVQLSMKHEFDYDITDGFFSDGEASISPRSRKRRAVDQPMNGFAARIGTRFPSFSQKWRLRKAPSTTALTTDAHWDFTQRATSSGSRSPSISNSARTTLDRPLEYQMPPTPTRSVFGSREHLAGTIDIERANKLSEESDVEQNLATTPLLPPLMMDASANVREFPMQSPLQSPSVAESSDHFSGSVTPIDSITTPQLPGIPSPPLSTKPSTSSFHRTIVNRSAHLVPSSEIPGIMIGEPEDEWSHKLGHANFTIHPEPYAPEDPDVEACRQLRAHWDLARCNYAKHLVRTGEHYGVTSNIYKYTEEKWAATEATWRKYNDITISSIMENPSDPFATMKHTALNDSENTNVMSRIPSLNDGRTGGKFPQMGDEDIVGPMVQAAAQIQRSPSKKAKIIRFFTEKFPVGLGKY